MQHWCEERHHKVSSINMQSFEHKVSSLGSISLCLLCRTPYLLKMYSVILSDIPSDACRR